MPSLPPRVDRWLDELDRRIPPTVSLPGLAAALAALLFWSWANCGVAGCPDVGRLASYQPGGAPVLVDRNGERIADLRPVRHGLVPLDSLPGYVGDAFIAVEDRRFRSHHGIDLTRIGGAVVANVKAGGVAQGSSTITMQLSRNLFADRLPARERTLKRKLLEARVALEIESEYTKDEILQLYLNHIFFGGSAYGIEAGARRYFDRPASRLTLAQAATLAALPKAPTSYDPIEHPDRARERRDLVLTLMERQGRVDADEAERARESPLGVRRGKARGAAEGVRVAGWFVDRVRNELEERLGDDLYHRPLVVHTSLDLRLQKAAERELERQLSWIERGGTGRFEGPRRSRGTADSSGTDYLQGAVVVMDADSGDVLALVGGRDYASSAFDRATRARRQAGSTIKPFVYAAALEDGWSPSDSLVDEPLELDLDGRTWSPRNYDDRFLGRVTVRSALVGSRNVPTVRLASDVGPDQVADVARDAGMHEEFRSHPMIGLGVVAVSPLEVAESFTPFATLGERVEPRLVLRVEDADGNTVWAPEPRRERIMKTGVAYVVTDMLRDAVDAGTGRRVRDVGFRGPAAGKTGTTNDAADAWFAGYTPDLVGVVWVGFDRRRTIAPKASGGRAAAPVWGRLMRDAYARRSRPDAWERPAGVEELAIDRESGRPIAEDCDADRDGLRRELFLDDANVDTVCPGDHPNVLQRLWGWVRGLFGGGDEEQPPERKPRPRPRPGRTERQPEPERPAPLGVELDSIEADSLEARIRRLERLDLEPDAVLPPANEPDDVVPSDDAADVAPPADAGPPGQSDDGPPGRAVGQRGDGPGNGPGNGNGRGKGRGKP